jgi:hypothetical protein
LLQQELLQPAQLVSRLGVSLRRATPAVARHA